MKIFRNHSHRPDGSGPGAPKRSEGGSITFVFIVLLSIMVILVAVNAKTLFRLHREVKLLEQQQIKRLDAPQTNAVVIIKPDSP
jgi:hypothetical protein